MLPSAEAGLFAVTDAGPRPVPVAGRPQRLDDLYGALQLGVYTVLRTYGHGRFVGLDHHLARLADSVVRAGLEHVIDEPRLRRNLQAVCERVQGGELRLRVDVLPAATALPERELIGHEVLHLPPPAAYQHGVAAVTVAAIERHDPRAKTADFAARRRALAPRDPGVFEAFMVTPDGLLTEGLSSSFFAVRDAALYTAGERVLDGVTRRIVLGLAAGLGVPVHLQALARTALGSIDEAFLSSSSRGLLPVVSIDGVRIGDGVPGPVTRRLMQAYAAHIEASAHPAVA